MLVSMCHSLGLDVLFHGQPTRSFFEALENKNYVIHHAAVQ